MAKADSREMAILPTAIIIAMTKLFHSISPIGGAPAFERPSRITVR